MYKNQRSDRWLSVINPDLEVGAAKSVCGGRRDLEKISKFKKI